MSLLEAVRTQTNGQAWSAAVNLVRKGAVKVRNEQKDEICLSVKVQNRALPFEVYLWPNEEDWGCDCSLVDGACVHVAAAAIFLNQRGKGAKPVTAPSSTGLKLRYRLKRDYKKLKLERQSVTPNGTTQPLPASRGSLASLGIWASEADLDLERLLAIRINGSVVPRDLWPKVMAYLADAKEVYLDDTPITCSGIAVSGIVRIEDDGSGFLLRLVRDDRIEEVFEGVVRCGNTLHPSEQTALTPEQRALYIKGIHYSKNDVGRLISDILPRLKGRVPIDIRTNKLPSAVKEKPVLRLVFSKKGRDLEILPIIVYGNLARLDGNNLVTFGNQVPLRDPKAEDTKRQDCSRVLGVSPGHKIQLSPEDAILFVEERLPTMNVEISGQQHVDAFKKVYRKISPKIELIPSGQRYRVQIHGDGARPEDILAAWRHQSSLVPLLDGGFAPLPKEWLAENGWRLEELLSSMNTKGEIDTQTLPTAIAFANATNSPIPPSLDRLKALMMDFTGVPITRLPAINAELRSYQHKGVDWLAFIRELGMGGVLADDMGLGKTLQALTAIATVKGRNLVVCPTSVIRNWELEARKFVPNLKVCVYHGPKRVMDPNANLVITSYALLRRDLELLSDELWNYAILDEAQAIKNPDSQVAQASRQLEAEYRLALTGTPVENRLEELWSIFAFVIPGLLGGRKDFTERVTSVLGSDPHALTWLRQRVRPFLMRRMKQEVAPELPSRTDMIIHCELDDQQRKIYDALFAASRDEALRAINQNKTFSILELLLRLRQAACHPGLLKQNGGSGKVEVLREKLAEIISEGHKALVFSQWTSFLDLLEDTLKHDNINYCRLDGSTRDRQAVVDNFQSDNGPPVFLISLKAGGTGLNLTAADYVFHMDPWWNPAVEDQAVDRAHRIGQQRPVISCRLVSSDTIEERIIDLQESKRSLARAAVGDEELTHNLTKDDLKALFE